MHPHSTTTARKPRGRYRTLRIRMQDEVSTITQQLLEGETYSDEQRYQVRVLLAVAEALLQRQPERLRSLVS